MELIVGKTAYKTNEYLFLGKNSSGLIAESNINHLVSLYKTHLIENLNYFESSGNNLFFLRSEFEKKIKRPGVIVLQEKESDKKVLFLRDDLFFKLNNDMKKDPVLNYDSYVKIENNIHLNTNKKHESSYSNKFKI